MKYFSRQLQTVHSSSRLNKLSRCHLKVAALPDIPHFEELA